MTTASLNPCMSLNELHQLDISISRQLDDAAPRRTRKAAGCC